MTPLFNPLRFGTVCVTMAGYFAETNLRLMRIGWQSLSDLNPLLRTPPVTGALYPAMTPLAAPVTKAAATPDPLHTPPATASEAQAATETETVAVPEATTLVVTEAETEAATAQEPVAMAEPAAVAVTEPETVAMVAPETVVAEPVMEVVTQSETAPKTDAVTPVEP